MKKAAFLMRGANTFDYQRWEDAFAECGIDTDFYTMQRA